jgi:alpha-1,6-mannosyltransferase
MHLPYPARWIYISAGLLLCSLALFAVYIQPRSDFWGNLKLWAIWFGCYAAIYHLARRRPIWNQERWWLVIGIAQRFLLLWALPNLSEDVYRFLWDGRVAAASIHPFAFTPETFLQQYPSLPGLNDELFRQLNSPKYHTIYPPLAQGLFWLAAKCSPLNVYGGALTIKIVLFAAEIGTICGLRAWEKPGVRRGLSMAALYALNPLLILEICGNAHIEGLMLFLLLQMFLALRAEKTTLAAMSWAGAVAVKLVPFIALPFVFVYLGWKKGLQFAATGLFCLLVLFIPLSDWAVLQNMAGSLDLYFRQFQFNACVYYVVREIGRIRSGWDYGVYIGPCLGIVSAGIIGLMSLLPPYPRDLRALSTKIGDALLIYLLFAAVVHPWYITVPLLFGILSGRHYVLLWSFVVLFSYSHYRGGGLQENFWMIGAEYVLLLASRVGMRNAECGMRNEC